MFRSIVRFGRQPRVEPERPGITAEQSKAFGESMNGGVHWAMVFAILESNNKGLTETGRPVLRFEKHKWKKFTSRNRAARVYDRARNPRDYDDRYEQYLGMRMVHHHGAMLSHSWGVFQIMGFNHRLAGYENWRQFELAMDTIEGQLKAWRSFVLANPPLLSALRKDNAQAVAYHYNGPAYAMNRYDVRFAQAVAQAKGQMNTWV